jgi:hypothetical protein
MDAWPLVLFMFTSGHALANSPTRECRCWKGTHAVADRNAKAVALEVHAWPSWDDWGLYHGMIGRWYSLHLATRLPTRHQGDVATARERMGLPDDNACDVATGSTRFVVRG